MTKVIFWNVQRLGSGSADERKNFRSKYISELNEKHKPDLMLFCEITSDVDIDDISITKLLAVAKRDKSKRAAQLGYGLLSNTDHIDDDSLKVYEIPNYNTLFDENFGGGNNFYDHSKRRLVKIGSSNGTEIFMYHSNASYISSELVAWATLGIYEKHQKFILIGDLNCDPPSLRRCLRRLPKSESIDVHSGKKATHDGGRILDYIVYSGCNPSITTLDTQWDFQQSLGSKKRKRDISDHHPIMVEF